jgi:hypothetical protein
VKSWRAPLYALAIWLGLFVLWFATHALTGQVGNEDTGAMDIDLFSGESLLPLVALVLALSVFATSLGVIVARLLAPRDKNTES